MAVEKNEKKPTEKLKKTVFFQAFKTLERSEKLLQTKATLKVSLF